MTTNELVKNKMDCCGCTACQNICPRRAIYMKEDEEGFLNPFIETELCVDCGLCQKVCEQLSRMRIETLRCYAAYAKDKNIQANSSSGGIFSLLAENILQNGGIVYGAAFNSNFEVEHVAVYGTDGMTMLRGSKYVQSALNNTFAQIKKYLEDGREILFSGTPCQVSGLKGYLNKEYSRLTTVDFICHGIPSPKVWKKYLQIMENEAQSSIVRISFRVKNSSWKRYAVSFLYKNDTAYLRYHGDDPFMRGFLQNLYLRPSCYSCRFKSNNRASDITLADFWGIENVLPEMDDDKGTSLIICNTTRGRDLLSQIENQMEIKEVPTSILPRCNPSFAMSAPMHPNREKFFKQFNREDTNIISLIYKYTREPLKRNAVTMLKMLLIIMGVMPLARKILGKK